MTRVRQAPHAPPPRELPQFIKPQLATLVGLPPGGPGWGHEIKIDGYRAQVRWDGARVSVSTRKGLDWTHRFPSIAAAGRSLPPGTILDGEAAVLVGDLPNFAALQAALANEDHEQVIFFAFDLLFEQWIDLRQEPLHTRKRRLNEVIEASGAGLQIRYLAHFLEGGSILEAARRLELEGIVSKPLDKPYRSGRVDWLKSKVRPGEELVIGGYEHLMGRFRSLLVGVYEGQDLRYVGHVGTGFSANKMKSLWPKLQKLKSSVNPFQRSAATRGGPNIQWIEPALVAEVEIGGWTRHGNIRQASFKALREDKNPTDVATQLPQATRPGAPSRSSDGASGTANATESQTLTESAMAAKKKSSSRRKKAAKRTLIAPKGDKRYVRRDKRGRIKESDDVGRSLSADRRRRAKRKAKPGQGDKGD